MHSLTSSDDSLQIVKILLNPPQGGFFYCIIWESTNEATSSMTLKLTDAEDAVLTECLSFLYDVGIPDHLDQDAFDSLWEKVFATAE